jgi:hypothetical protein
MVNKGPKAERNRSDQQRAEDYDQHIRWKSAFHEWLTPSNDPSSATAATLRADCNQSATPPFAAAHG